MRTFLWYSSRLRCASPHSFDFAQQVIDDTCCSIGPRLTYISTGEFPGPRLRPPLGVPPHRRPAASPEQVRFSGPVLWAAAGQPAPPSAESTRPLVLSWPAPAAAVHTAAAFRFRGGSGELGFRARESGKHRQLSTVRCSGSLHAAQSSQRLHNFPGPLGHLVLA